MRALSPGEIPRYQSLKKRLLEDYPNLDEETLADTLEGITDLHEMIAAVIRSALIDQALQAGLRSRVAEMKQRLTRLEDRELKKRHLALAAMSEAGLKTLEQPDFTASTRSGSPTLAVVDEELIPDSYWRPQPPKLDRTTILANLKQGEDIAGVQLGNPKPVLTVRTK